MPFTEALQHLVDGKCIGIKPKGNNNYVVKYKPHWMNQDSTEHMLCWNRSVKEGKGETSIRTNQYLNEWFLVVIDCNDLPENIKQSFVLENITGLL